MGKGLALDRMRILSWLWQNGVNAEQLLQESPKPQKQLSHAFDELVPMILWVGEDEVKSGVFNLKVLYKGVEVKGTLEELLPRIRTEAQEFLAKAAEGPIVFEKGEKDKKKK